MTWASANTQEYFKPALIKGDVYISGNNNAISPSLFGFLHATEKGEDPSNLRVFRIAGTRDDPP